MSESLRIRYLFPHYLILCQRASERLLWWGRAGWGVEDSHGLLAGFAGCADTHVIVKRDTNKPVLGSVMWVLKSIHAALDTIESISPEADVKLHSACLLTALHGLLTLSAGPVAEFTACTVCYYVLTSARIAGDLGVKVGEGKEERRGRCMHGAMEGKRGFRVGT